MRTKNPPSTYSTECIEWISDVVLAIVCGIRGENNLSTKNSLEKPSYEWRQPQEIYLDKYSVDKLIKMENILAKMISQLWICAGVECIHMSSARGQRCNVIIWWNMLIIETFCVSDSSVFGTYFISIWMLTTKTKCHF